MFENLWMDGIAGLTALYAMVPLALKSSVGYARKCRPVKCGSEHLPADVAQALTGQRAAIEELGFRFDGYYDLGEVACHTRTYVALFRHDRKRQIAAVTAMKTATDVRDYVEFTSLMAYGEILETNTNDFPPVMDGAENVRTYRFPEVEEPRKLYELHLELCKRYPAMESNEEESPEWPLEFVVQRTEGFGARQTERGWLRLDETCGQYRLTWKGAVLMAWRALWPVALLRSAMERRIGKSELRSQGTRAAAVLQKA